MMNKQPTPQEIEQAKSDCLYVALIIRQRLRNAELIREQYPIGNDGSITLSAGEADVLLKHFSSMAEKASDLAGQLAAERQRIKAVRSQGEKWERDARHANEILAAAFNLFKPYQWQVEKQEDLGWMIHSPRVKGVASHTVVWEDAENPAEALLALLLDALITTGEAGGEVGPL